MDRCQIDFRGWMYKTTPALLYVAMSRARTLEGLRMVGTAELLAERCRVSAEVVRWL